jgi:hypothetical protein
MKSIMKQVKERKMNNFWLRDGILYFWERIYVPKLSNLGMELTKESHESPYVVHLRQ